MFGDTNSLPIGGSVLLAAAAYAVISAFVTGPLVAERTIERGGWESSCRANLKDLLLAEENASVSESEVIPRFDCNSVLGLFGAEGRQVCRRHGNFEFRLPGMEQLEARQRQMREMRQRRLDAAIGNVASRCACAAAVTMEARRIPFAIYAGSARLITPVPVKNLSNELEASLGSPLCTAKG